LALRGVFGCADFLAFNTLGSALALNFGQQPAVLIVNLQPIVQRLSRVAQLD